MREISGELELCVYSISANYLVVRLDDARSALQTLGNGNPLKVSFLDTKGLL